MGTAAFFMRQIVESLSNAQVTEIVPFFNATPGFIDALRTISDLVRLGDNWDSYGSPCIQQAAVERAVQVLCAADREDPPPPRVCAGLGRWAAGARELEIEILPDGSTEFLEVEGSQVTEELLPAEEICLVVPKLLLWLSREKAQANTSQVPSRSFPFAAHLNFLALPVVEGINFDADDFVED